MVFYCHLRKKYLNYYDFCTISIIYVIEDKIPLITNAYLITEHEEGWTVKRYYPINFIKDTIPAYCEKISCQYRRAMLKLTILISSYWALNKGLYSSWAFVPAKGILQPESACDWLFDEILIIEKGQLVLGAVRGISESKKLSCNFISSIYYNQMGFD